MGLYHTILMKIRKNGPLWHLQILSNLYNYDCISDKDISLSHYSNSRSRRINTNLNVCLLLLENKNFLVGFQQIFVFYLFHGQQQYFMTTGDYKGISESNHQEKEKEINMTELSLRGCSFCLIVLQHKHDSFPLSL